MMRRLFVLSCLWDPSTTSRPPSCAGPLNMTEHYSGVYEVSVPRGSSGVVVSSGTVFPTGQKNWSTFAQGNHTFIAPSGATAYLVDAGARASGFGLQVGTYEVAVPSTIPVQSIVRSISGLPLTYAGITLGRFARVESNTTAAETLVTTISFTQKNATALETADGKAGAFFAADSPVPTVGLPGVSDARWTLPVQALLISLSTTSPGVDGSSLKAALKTQLLGYRAVLVQVPDPPSQISLVADNLSLITPMFTLAFSVITTGILLLNFWRSSKAAKEEQQPKKDNTKVAEQLGTMNAELNKQNLLHTAALASSGGTGGNSLRRLHL